ncbi:MAG: O-antigen ligase family protein [Rubrobacteraceae bacterium]
MTEKLRRAELGESRERARMRRTNRRLAIFKTIVLLLLMATTVYGMLRSGLYRDELWLPVAAGILGLLLVTLFVRGYYLDVPRIGWVLVILLAVLVGIKGLSMIWTISEAQTVREFLRSSMYLATFIMVLGALSSNRQIPPLMDFAILTVAAVSGYGLLQKINPVGYPVTSLDAVRVDSTLEYANTLAVVLGMGVTLTLARLTDSKNAVVRGIYAALLLAFLTILYLSFSRGGIVSLVVGLAVLVILTSSRLQMVTNLILVSIPGAWLLWRIQSLEGLLRANVPEQQKLADGATFQGDLIVTLAAAFALQFGYALLVNRYELAPTARRAVGGLFLVGVIALFCVGAFAVIQQYGGAQQAYDSLLSNPTDTENPTQRLASLSIGFRSEYWQVAWQEWKQHPFLGTGAGTFQFTWLEDRSGFEGVKQVHNVYLEQGTETGVFAFLALVGFAGLLAGYTMRAAWLSSGGQRIVLSGLAAAEVTYLVSSIAEWHWYLPSSTLLFFIVAAISVKAAREYKNKTNAHEVADTAGVGSSGFSV